MEVILHIGTDKTGSTSIQSHVYINRNCLLSRSVYVPTTGLGKANGHSALMSSLDAGMLRDLSRELEVVEKSGYKQVLLSWEGMHLFSHLDIYRLNRALGRRPVRIVVYLREQAEIIQTGVLQQLKSNWGGGPVPRFARSRIISADKLGVTVFFARNRDYYRMLRRWRRVISGAKFEVAVFNKKDLQDGDVVSDFFGRIGLATGSGFKRLEGDINVSLDVESGILVERWISESRSSEDIERLTDIARAIIKSDGGGSKYFLSEASVLSLREAYAKSNRKLGRTFFQGRETFFADRRNCWREESLESVKERALILERKIEQIDKTPTLYQTVSGEVLSGKLDLAQGWSGQEKWGVWSKGKYSTIRFRLRHAQIAGDVKAVRIVVRGHYHGANEATVVKINGIEFGPQELTHRHPGLEVPIEALLPYEIVELELFHQAPHGPRNIAFGLKSLGRIIAAANEPEPVSAPDKGGLV